MPESNWVQRILADDADRYLGSWMSATGELIRADDSDTIGPNTSGLVATMRHSILAMLEYMVVDMERFNVAEASASRRWQSVRGATLLWLTASLLGPRDRQRYMEQWTAHLAELPKQRRFLFVASLIIGIPSMIIALRWDRRGRQRR